MRGAASLFLSAFLSLSTLWGFHGRIVDDTGSPVANAQVSIVGHSGSVQTDRGGFFRWSPDPKPPFEILVVLPGGQYVAPQMVEKLPASAPLVITVSPVAVDRITVTAAVTPNIEVPVANALTVVSRNEIRLRQPRVLAEALRDIPGVEPISEGVAAVPAIRGLARGRTLLLLDGGRVSTERRLGPSATFMDPFFLEGVEVARGPGSVAYGSDAIGGVIHMRTRRPEFEMPVRFRFQGSLGWGLPSGGMGVEHSQGGKLWSYLLQGSFRQLGDYDSPVEEVTNSSARFQNVLARTSFRTNFGQLSVGLQSDHGRDIGRPRTSMDVERFLYPREDSDRLIVGLETAPPGGFSLGKLEFFLGSYRLVTRRDTLPTPASGRKLTDSDVSSNDFGFRTLFVRPLERTRWEFGVDFNGRFNLSAEDREALFDLDEQLVDLRDVNSIEDAKSRELAGFTSIEALLAPSLTGSAGIRLSHFSSRSRGVSFGTRSSSDGAAAGFLSLKFEPVAGLDLVGQVARGYRQPLLSDRYYTGVTARGTITGNPELEPESSVQFDLAVRYSLRSFHWAVYTYRYRIDDLIERYEVADERFSFRNRGRGRLSGVELESSWNLNEETTLHFGAQMARGRPAGETGYLDDVPAENCSVALIRNILDGGYFQIRAVAYARDKEPGPTEVVFPGYGLLDLAGGWRFESRFQVGLQVRNVFDKDHPVNPDRRAVSAPGRSVAIQLNLDL